MIVWPDIFFNPTMQLRLQRLLSLRFSESSLAEEAYTHVLEKLSADHWRVLHSFRGTSSPETFLFTTFRHGVEDFVRARFGRPRPPLWLQRLGVLWEKIFHLLCLERQEPEWIVAFLTQQEVRQEQQVRQAVDVVMGRITDCGEHRQEMELEQEVWDVLPATTPNAEQQLAEREWRILHDFLSRLLDKRSIPNPPSGHPLERALMNAFAQLELTDLELLILKMVYQDALTLTTVSQRLGIPAHQVRHKCQNVLQRLRLALQQAGIQAEELFGHDSP